MKIIEDDDFLVSMRITVADVIDKIGWKSKTRETGKGISALENYLPYFL